MKISKKIQDSDCQKNSTNIIYNKKQFLEEEDIVISNIVLNRQDQLVSIAPPKVPIFSILSEQAKLQLNSEDGLLFSVIPAIKGSKFQIFFEYSAVPSVCYENGEIASLFSAPNRIKNMEPSITSDLFKKKYVFSYIDDGTDVFLTHIYDKEKNTFLSVLETNLIGKSVGIDIYNIASPCLRFHSFGSLRSELDRHNQNFIIRVDKKDEMFAEFFYSKNKKINLSNINPRDFFDDPEKNSNTKKIVSMLGGYFESEIINNMNNKNHKIGSAIDRGRSSKNIARLLIPSHIKQGKRVPKWLEEKIDDILHRIKNY